MQKNRIPSERQINLQPGLRKLARELENSQLNEKRLSELRGMVRVLNGLAVYLHGDFENDDKVLQKEFDHLVSDVHEGKKHPSESYHNQIHADLCAMISTMLGMANDNVIAVSKIDCARVFIGALESAEEIFQMPKTPSTYLSEAIGMIDTVCHLMHIDSYFPDQDITLAQHLQTEIKNGSHQSIRILRSHLQRIGG
ncbi:MAG: hypothetical protein KDK44_05785 [Chlamydiia bacterium]|nr:hypothetical protein [Chlamydiia bacterium]MCP5509110.1 hypothetical protein [Chlamydiales bacterium]